MSPRKLFGLALTALLAYAAMAPALADNLSPARRPISLEAARHIRTLYSSEFPAYRLGNDVAMHYIHVRNTLQAITAADTSLFGMEAGKVNFRPGWHPKPYSTPAEDTAMFQLGVLMGFGKVAIVNSNIPEFKDYAQSIVKTLVGITEKTMLSDMTGDFNSVLQTISDPTFAGGPGPVLDKYDALITRLADRVYGMYLRDGFWNYTAGLTLAGLHAVPDSDAFHFVYFKNMLQKLYNNYPSKGLPFNLRQQMASILRTPDYVVYSVNKPQDAAMRAIWLMYPFSKTAAE